MTSTDNTIDLQLRELIIANREQIAEIKGLAAQLQKDNAEFRSLMIKEFSDFKDSVDSRLTSIHAEISQINQRITGLEHDVSGLYHWDYWLLSIILVVIALPHLVDIVKSMAGVITDSIASISAIFRRKDTAKK